jgi:hypothetical protein
VHAVARILLDGDIDNIQVSWVKAPAWTRASRSCAPARERFRRHFDGGNDQQDGRRRVGIEMTPDMFDDAIRATGVFLPSTRRHMTASCGSETPQTAFSVSMVDGSRQSA